MATSTQPLSFQDNARLTQTLSDATNISSVNSPGSVTTATMATQTKIQLPRNTPPSKFPSPPYIDPHDITVLYTPREGVEVAADLVFVHGLMGHPQDTWFYGNSSTGEPEGKGSKNGWNFLSMFRSGETKVKKGSKAKGGEDYCDGPFHFLPFHFDNVRVLTYGYDSHPTHWYGSGTNQMTISNHGQQLLDRVTRERAGCRGRPLIFVAHSLGGILVKDALFRSSQAKEHQENLLDLEKSCRHILFFGTPHLGADIASWGTWFADKLGKTPGGPSTYQEILRGLERDSETLDNIHDHFSSLINNDKIPVTERIHISSFLETAGPGSFKGAGSKIVSAMSSKLNRPEIERVHYVQSTNHMKMCKFPRELSAPYKDFAADLTDYLKEIASRKQAAQQQVDARQAAERQNVLNGLNFDDRLARVEDIRAKLNRLIPPSLEWVWSSKFVDWIQSSEPIFWIAGHPASGKSTLMNYLSNEGASRLRDLLPRKNTLIVSFFFDYRAPTESIRNNFEGVKRSLLFQLLESLGNIADEAREHFGIQNKESREWRRSSLKLSSMLEFVLNRLTDPVLLFMDGLDEYGGDKPELLDLIDTLITAGMRICLASRDETPFSIRIAQVASFRTDQINRLGIEHYACHFLNTCLKPATDQKVKTIQSQSKSIAEKSSGVFLWARFAVFTLIEAENSGLDELEQERRLAEIPPKLQEVYARIFKSKTPIDKKKCGILLLLITAARRDLLLSELFEAFYLTGLQERASDEIVNNQDLERFEKFILNLGGGVIELCPFSPDLEDVDVFYTKPSNLAKELSYDFVKIIHRTVLTYLEQEGWSTMLGDDKEKIFKDLVWLRVCGAFFKGPRLNWARPERFRIYDFDGAGELPGTWLLGSGPQRSLEFAQAPLDDYAGRFLPFHAFSYEAESDESSWPLIHEAMNQSTTSFHDILWTSHPDTRCCSFGYAPWALTSGLQLAIAHALINYVKEHLSRHPEDPNLTNRFDQSTLCYRHSKPWVRYREIKDCTYSQIEDRIAIEAEEYDKDRLDLLQTAVLYSCISWEHSAERSALVELLAPISPPLQDQDMLYAIQNAPARDVKALSTHFPRGDFELKSVFVDHRFRRDDEDIPSELNVFGPLWAVGCRQTADEDTEQVLDFFLNRGADINGICGPYGTSCHAAILHWFNHSSTYNDLQSLLLLLESRGADLNRQGSHGNVLEFAWTLAQSQKRGWDLIKFLIRKGVKTGSEDSSGKFPSIEEMSACFGESSA